MINQAKLPTPTQADQSANRPFLIFGESGIQLSYEELAGVIKKLEILTNSTAKNNKKTIISCILNDRMKQAVTLLACLHNDVIFNPINPELNLKEINTLLRHSDSDYLILDKPDSQIYRLDAQVIYFEDLIKNNEDTVAVDYNIHGDLLIYTSGTTGTPKGVLLSNKQIKNNVETACQFLPFRDNITTCSILPLHHSFTIISDILTALACNGSCVINPTFTAKNAALFAQNTHKYTINSFSAVPVIFETLAVLNADLSNELEFAVSGAAPLSEAIYNRYQSQYKHRLIPCYGMTEATCFITISPANQIKPGSPGQPVNIDLKIIDDQRNTLAAMQRGEIIISGDSVIQNNYFKGGDNYSSLFSDDGWLHTGDIGYLDKNGYLFITGRKKNMVIRGGEKIYLEDIEQCLLESALVNDVIALCLMVNGSHDKAVIFAVKAAPSINTETISLHVRNNLGPQHLPDKIIFVTGIPRTATGKPDRKSLDEILREAS